MAKNRFLLGESDYDLKYEFRVADLSRVERTIEDFWNEEEEIFEYLEFLNYLYMNNAFLTKEEANKIFNGLHEENTELQHKLSQQEMEYATDLCRLAEENRRLQHEVDSYKIFQTEARELVKENEELKQKVNFYKDFQKEVRELAKENEGLKKELTKFKEWEKHIGDVKREELDRVFKMSIYEIAEAFEYYKKRIKKLEETLQEWSNEDKNCGHCKHLQIDGMFGMWCDKGRKWQNTDADYCPDYGR